ncbi:MAG TPA: vanadium-dependent haloperoxidase [Opitutaceae bacterium]|nr:vanadium-dependent haloperoxidase [Opitutaceae bacterium]
MKIPRLAAAFIAACILSASPSFAENAVLYWNHEALNATRLARNPPPVSSFYFATFHAAIFDVVNSITRTRHGWAIDEPAPAGIAMDAAIAGAAHRVMVSLWSASSNPHDLQTAYDKALAAIPDGPAKTQGIAWGEHVANAVLAKIATAGYNKPIPGKYTSMQPGKWRETPSQFRPPLLPFWGRVRPFVLTSSDQFRAPPPEALGSKAYAEELAFVGKKGARDNADRTEYQTMSTPFWNDDLGTGTPPGHWNMVAADIAGRRHLSEPDCALLFALLNFADADAAIGCWETKYYYNVWRPETALRELNPSLNPYAKEIPTFIPNMPSPPFPTYTSGHSTFSAASARLMALYFGTDDIPFSLTSDALPGVVRHYNKLSDAQKEAGMSRVWGGIHTMSDNLQAQKMGVKIAEWVFSHALLPLNASTSGATPSNGHGASAR